LSYSQARADAARLRELIAKGIDPVQAKEQEKAKSITYAEACEAFIAHHASHRWRGTKNPKNLLGQASSLNPTPVHLITRTMIEDALRPQWERRPYQVIRALPMIANMLDYAKFKGWRTGENPAAWKGNMQFVFGGLQKRENHHRSLSFKNMPQFMQRLRLRQVRGTSAVALEFLILTAARSGEVRGAQWSEFDLINRVWTIPPERTKQGRQHRVPLCQRCMDILALQYEYRTDRATIPTGPVFQGYNRTTLDEKALRVLLRNMKVPVTPHGFRHSFRNWAFTTRQDRDLAELSLGHTVAKDRTEGAYLTVDGLEERRPLMEAWASFCSGS
jgi:integrase